MYSKSGYVSLLAKYTTLNKNPMRLLTVLPRLHNHEIMVTVKESSNFNKGNVNYDL